MINERNILFVWIAKNAGTSVYNTLNENVGMKLYLDNYREFDNKGPVTFGHLSIKHLLRDGTITKDFYQSSKVFAVVRNPYSRFVSLWKDFKRSHRISPRTTLTEFAFACTTMDREIGLYNVKGYSQCACQVDWLLPGMTILRFETIGTEFEKEFGIELAYDNSSGSTEWMKYYDSESEKLVRSMFADSFAILGYDNL